MAIAFDLPAPGYSPEAANLPWMGRALAQGAAYTLPSSIFVLAPLLYIEYLSWARAALLIMTSLAVAGFYVGSALVMHWEERARWLWLLALSVAIIGVGVASNSVAPPTYYVPYVTTSASTLIAWRRSRFIIVASTLLGLGVSAIHRDMFGVFMAIMAFAVGVSIRFGFENQRTREALRREEERTAVLAVAAERERIGRDLHDILGHSLTAIAVKADLAWRLVGRDDRDDEGARREIEGIAVVARQALADVRSTAHGMREVRLATEVAAARSVLGAAGIECRAPSSVPTLDDKAAEVLGYAVREGVTNVVRHSGATRCDIEVEETGMGVTVRDNGQGIPAGRRHVGLDGLALRMEQAGGSLQVESGPDGTCVRAALAQLTPEDGA